LKAVIVLEPRVLVNIPTKFQMLIDNVSISISLFTVLANKHKWTDLTIRVVPVCVIFGGRNSQTGEKER